LTPLQVTSEGTLRRFLLLVPEVLLTCSFAGLVPASCFAQEEVNSARLEAVALAPEANAAASASWPAAASNPASLPAAPVPFEGGSPRIGLGLKLGTLGIGGEVGVRLLHSANVRFGFSGLTFGYNFTHDGIGYGAKLRMEGAQATFDYFLFRGFHVSPGALLYNGTKISGSASVVSGTTFTLNGITYESSAATPVTGSVDVTFRKVAPVLLFGFGNLVPRGGRHWSISSDFGVAFSGSPNAALNLTGLVCAPGSTSGPTCLDVASNSTVQANVIVEQSNVNSHLSFFKIYPVISVGFGYSF
jgi:hypothetical protein